MAVNPVRLVTKQVAASPLKMEYFKQSLSDVRLAAFDALADVAAYRANYPRLECDQVRWVSEKEYYASRAVVLGAIEAHDRALSPSTPEFLEGLLGTLSAGYPLPKGTEQDIGLKLDVYIDALRGFPPDLLAGAARKALRRRTFFPTIAELLGAGEPDGVEAELNERIDDRNRMARRLDMPPVPHMDAGGAWC